LIQNSLRATRAPQPILGVVLLVLSSFILLSLISYSSQDPSWSFSASEATDIHNLGGRVGSFLSDAFLQSLGLVSYLFGISLFVIGFRRLRGSVQDLEASKRKDSRSRKWKLPVALALGCLCVAGLLSLTPWTVYADISAGGLLGHFVARFAVFCISPVGAALFFAGGLWIALILTNEKMGALPRFSIPKMSVLLKIKSAIVEIKESIKLPRFRREKDVDPFETKVDVSQKLDELFKNRRKKSDPTADKEHSNPETQKLADEDISDEPRLPLFSFGKPKSKPLAGERQLLVERAPVRSKKIEYHDFEFPSLQLLDRLPEDHFEVSKNELIENSKALEQKLFDFGIQGRVTDIKPGPIITLYEFEPAAGVKVKNILNLTDDLKLAMKAVSVRIVAPIPGKAAVGIEIPNHRRQMVALRDILSSPIFQNSSSPLTIAMGKTTGGDPFIADLAKMPHLLIAGATGSGKSVGLNGMIVSTLYKSSPEELKFIMIDPKMLELSVYEGIPHLLLPVVTDPKKASRALHWAVKEMERRYKLISSLGARNLKSYNDKVERLSREELEKEIQMVAREEAATSALIEDQDDAPEKTQQEIFLEEMGMDHYVKLPLICIVIDELADLMIVAGREVEESITRLAQMARAAGIHLILATQRPSVDVITGVIKANFPTRVAYQVASKIDSRTILDGTGAENLIGDGDMLFLPPGTSRLERLHGPFISEEEIDRVVRHLKAQGRADYSDSINLDEQAEGGASIAGFDDLDDELYDQALQVVFETQSPSASMLQRRLRVGYNRAARLVERMEAEGIVSPPLSGGKGRELLVSPSYMER